jgi:hypothetical protein
LPHAKNMTPAMKFSYLPDPEGRTALYKRLYPANQEIRILMMWPSENFASPLECTLQTRSLVGSETLYKYDALSYYWGSVNDLSTFSFMVRTMGRRCPLVRCL